jgi:NTP pyrophosphatase (non-canonical NTP hydrolase)
MKTAKQLELFDKNNDIINKDRSEEKQIVKTETAIVIKSLDELQKELFEWQKRNFNKNDTGIPWMVIGAAEEVGEICHVVLKARQKIREHQQGFDEKAKFAIADGVADATIYLMQLCSHSKISFGETLFSVAKEVLKRNWKEKKKNGVEND